MQRMSQAFLSSQESQKKAKNLSSLFVSKHPCCFLCCSVAKSSPTLRLHGPQHTRLPCPSLSPRVCSNSCPFSQCRYLTISSSGTPFSFCLQSSVAAGSFPMNCCTGKSLSKILYNTYKLTSSSSWIALE